MNLYTMQSVTPIDPREMQVPPRVQAAMSFVSMVRSTAVLPPSFEGAPLSTMPLRPTEAHACDAALRMLSQYFSGEMDFGSVSVRPAEPPEDTPPAPEPTPVKPPQPVTT